MYSGPHILRPPVLAIKIWSLNERIIYTEKALSPMAGVKMLGIVKRRGPKLQVNMNKIYFDQYYVLVSTVQVRSGIYLAVDVNIEFSHIELWSVHDHKEMLTLLQRTIYLKYMYSETSLYHLDT